MAYRSREFPFIGDPEVAAATCAAAVFNDTLFVISAMNNPFAPGPSLAFYTVQTTFDLKHLNPTSTTAPGDDPINDDGLTDIANWITDRTPPLPPTAAQPALAATPDALYAFFNTFYEADSPSAQHPLAAAKYSLAKDRTQPGTWGPLVSLLQSDNSTGPVPNTASGMSAAVIGDTVVIVTCAQAVLATNPRAAPTSVSMTRHG